MITLQPCINFISFNLISSQRINNQIQIKIAKSSTFLLKPKELQLILKAI